MASPTSTSTFAFVAVWGSLGEVNSHSPHFHCSPSLGRPRYLTLVLEIHKKLNAWTHLDSKNIVLTTAAHYLQLNIVVSSPTQYRLFPVLANSSTKSSPPIVTYLQLPHFATLNLVVNLLDLLPPFPNSHLLMCYPLAYSLTSFQAPKINFGSTLKAIPAIEKAVVRPCGSLKP